LWLYSAAIHNNGLFAGLMPEAKLRKVLFYSNYNRKGRWNHYVPTAFAIDSTSAIGASAELLK
jgi:hypothetical protein